MVTGSNQLGRKCVYTEGGGQEDWCSAPQPAPSTVWSGSELAAKPCDTLKTPKYCWPITEVPWGTLKHRCTPEGGLWDTRECKKLWQGCAVDTPHCLGFTSS